MGVQDPAGERVEDRRPDDPHVAGQDHDIRPGALEDVVEDLVGAVRHEGDVDPLLRRPLEGRTGPIGHDEHDLATDLAPHRRRVERPEVGARLPRPRPRSVRSSDRLDRPLEVARPVRAVTRDDLADHGRLEALRAERVHRRGHPIRSHDDRPSRSRR